MTKIIIRYQVPHEAAGHNHELSAADKERLKKAAGFADVDNSDIQFSLINYSDPFRQSYCERVDIIHQGMQLLIKSLPPNHPKNTNENLDKVKAAAKQVHDNFIFKIQNLPNKDDINAYQKLLIEYLQQLEILLKHAVKLPDGNEPLKLLQNAEEWATASSAPSTVCTVIPFNVAKEHEPQKDGYLVQMDEPLSPLSEDIKQAFLETQILPSANHPLWFRLLPQAEQAILNQVLSGVRTKEEVAKRIPFLPNRLTKVPGVRNFWQHTIKMVQADGVILCQSSALRSSVVSADEMKGNKKDQKIVRKTIAEQNLQHVVDTALTKIPEPVAPKKPLLLVQSLLSPGIFPVSLDREIYSDKQQAVATLNQVGTVEIIDTNHAINGLGHVDRTNESGSTGKSGEQLIRRAKTYLRDIEIFNPEEAQAIRSLVNEYEYLLKHRNFWNGRAREFHLASYEALLARLLQKDSCFAETFCASGKDRNGIETNNVDTDFVFHYQHERVPRYENENDHQECRNLQALLFCGGEQQAIASKNAPGSAGIVWPPRYLTLKRQQSIIKQARANGYPQPEQILKHSDRLANNNNLIKVMKNANNFGVKKLTEAEEIELSNRLLRSVPRNPELLKPVNAGSFSPLLHREETKTVFAEKYTLKNEDGHHLIFETQDNDAQKPTIEILAQAIKGTNCNSQHWADIAEALTRIAQSRGGNLPAKMKFTTSSDEKFEVVKSIFGACGVRVERGGMDEGINPGRGPGFFAPRIESQVPEPVPVPAIPAANRLVPV